MSRSALHALSAAALPLLLYPILLFAGNGGTAPKPAATANAQNEGERLFAVNCGRCHQPPMNISPRTTGTIIMHMRTRARLSREDERALLKFLAP
jgi:mono/diheme cytochrome c family protein